MKYLPLSAANNLINWARTLITQITQRDAEIDAAVDAAMNNTTPAVVDSAANVRSRGFVAFPSGAGIEIVYAGGVGIVEAYNYSTASFLPLTLYGSVIRLAPGGTEAFSVSGALGNYANDAAAAAGGVPVKGLYRNGSQVMVRVV